MADRCQGVNKEGEPCSAGLYRDGWCRWHHPGLKEQRRQWSVKGGENRSNKARARKLWPDDALTPDDVRSLLAHVARRTLAGELDPSVANAMCNLGRVALQAHELAELVEFGRRVEAVEARASGERAG